MRPESRPGAPWAKKVKVVPRWAFIHGGVRGVCKCYVMNAVYAFAFTHSPLKLIPCNKQWLNTVLLSSLLKYWSLTLNYKRLDRCVCAVFMALFVISLKFVCWYLPKCSQDIASSEQGNKLVGFVISLSLKINIFYRCEKTGHIDFHEQGAQLK